MVIIKVKQLVECKICGTENVIVTCFGIRPVLW